jgi:hypothetical protein
VGGERGKHCRARQWLKSLNGFRPLGYSFSEYEPSWLGVVKSSLDGLDAILVLEDERNGLRHRLFTTERNILSRC